MPLVRTAGNAISDGYQWAGRNPDGNIRNREPLPADKSLCVLDTPASDEFFARPSDITSATVSYSPVQEFCRENQLFPEIRDAIAIAAQCFDATIITLSKLSDSETGEEWIEIAVDAKGTIEQLMEAEHRFILRMQDEVPPRVCAKVRLYLTSADD